MDNQSQSIFLVPALETVIALLQAQLAEVRGGPKRYAPPAAVQHPAPPAKTQTKRRSTMSPTARKRIADAQRARWAAKKQQEGATVAEVASPTPAPPATPAAPTSHRAKPKATPAAPVATAAPAPTAG